MESFFSDDTYIKKERDKARKLRAGQWWKRKRATGLCHYCAESFPPRELTMDHVIPLARGGRSEKFNLVACCKACNTKKQQLLPIEWDAYMDSIKK
ncbi:MAG: HNH endonuclease [Desulfobacula sp.]|nr:HNH endonuclease [Desulfobacula sp.]